MSFFNNRFTRLVVGAISEVAVILLVYYAINQKFASLVALYTVTSAVIGLAGLVLFDFLNIGFLNGKVGRIIKLVIFYVLLVLAIILNFSQDYVAVGNYVGDYTSSTITHEMGMSRAIITSMAGSALPLVALFVTVFSSESLLDDIRYPLVFSMAEGFVVSLVLSLILGSIYKGGANYETLYIISFVIGMVVLALGTLFFGLPFDYDDDWWCLRTAMSHKKRSYSSSYSSSGNRGSTTRTNSGSNTGSSGGGTGGVDKRKSGSGELSDRMRRIASSASGSHSLSYYSRVEFSVTSWVGVGTIRFTITPKIVPSSMVDNKAKADVITNEAKSAAQQLMSRLKSEAGSAVDDLRKTYKDYDGAYSIEFRPGN